MIKYILRQLKRSIVHNVAFCLLLVLAGTLLCLGAGLLITAVTSSREAGESFTTIAMPDMASIRMYSSNYTRNNNLTEFELPDGSVITPDEQYFNTTVTWHTERAIIENIADRVFASGNFDMDTRRIFGGYSPGILPQSNLTDRTMVGWIARASPHGAGAFIAVAENVRYEYFPAFDPIHGEFARETIVVTFSVEETLLLHHSLIPTPLLGFDIPPVRSFELTFGVRNADGTQLIEEGERYFVFGRNFSPADQMNPIARLSAPGYITLPVQSTFMDLDLIPTGALASIDDIPTTTRWQFRDIAEDKWPLQTYSHAFGEGDNPFENPQLVFTRFDTGYRWLIELPNDASAPLPDTLQREIDGILEMGQKSVNTLTVMTTGRLESYFHFNQRRARITEGRDFTREELETGARVAVINGLTEGVEVGDTITLYLYDTDVTQYQFYSMDGRPFETYWSILRPYSPVSLITDPMEFEVIGKFSAPRAEHSEYAIHPNAIFIPDNAIPEFPFIVPEMTPTLQRVLDEEGVSFDEWLLPRPLIDPWRISILNTIVLPNGRNQEFADAVNAILPEYAAFFRIYDQGYSIVRGALDNLLRGGTLIIILCFAGWLIAMLVFCLFYVLRKRKEAGLLYALGVNKKHRFRWLFVQCLIVIILSQIIAFGAASLLYERTVDYAIDAAENAVDGRVAIFSDAVMAEDGVESEFTIRRNPHAIPLAVAGQSIILLLISGGISAAIVNKGTQSLRRGGEG